MKSLERCVIITLELIELAKMADKSDRDQTIHRIEELLNQREELLPHIKGPFSPEESIAGKRLMQLNEELDVLLATFRAYIQKDMNELEQKKASATRYVNPYASVQEHDGVFYDKRQ